MYGGPALCAAVPTVLEIYLDRPAILTPFADTAAAPLVDFGASDETVLDVLFGASQARGKLPSSMDAVVDTRPDVPSDTANSLYPLRPRAHAVSAANPARRFLR